jgi:hypothetical protein
MSELHELDMIGDRAVAAASLAIMSERRTADGRVDQAAAADCHVAIGVAPCQCERLRRERQLRKHEVGIPSDAGAVDRLTGRAQQFAHRVVVNLGADVAEDAHGLRMHLVEVVATQRCDLGLTRLTL